MGDQDISPMTATASPADPAPSQRPWRAVFICVCLLLALAGACWTGYQYLSNKKKPLTQSEVRALVAATKQYFQEYRAFGGTDNASIIRELRGANTREIIFFNAPADRINAKGEFVDRWGTPYRMDVSDQANPRTWSCGPDRHDDEGKEGSDDIVSWR
jgi:hypothetical protein